MAETLYGVEYKKTDRWLANSYSDVFRVEVSRHDKYDGNGWCVYAIIFKEHALFPALLAQHTADVEYYDMPEVNAMPLHCGCTYFEPIVNGGSVIGFKIGADYSHLNDDHICEICDPMNASVVFSDAQDLLQYLSLKNQISDQTP
jgi:hypothetical protein